jgi:hypothetical protein
MLLAGIVIETLTIDNVSLPQVLMINFPQHTSISSSRELMTFDSVALSELERLFNRLLDASIETKFKISLINGLVCLCKDIIDSRRVSTDSEINQIRGLIKAVRSRIDKGALPILDTQIFLPNVPGIEYLEIGGKESIYLEAELFSEILIQAIPGSESIPAFIPGQLVYHAFKAPFKMIDNPSVESPLCFRIGSNIIIDELIYQQHTEKPFQIAALNQLNNVWIGSVNDPDIPKDNGFFISPLVYNASPEALMLNKRYKPLSEEELFEALSQASSTDELCIIRACVPPGTYSPGLMRLTNALKTRV